MYLKRQLFYCLCISSYKHFHQIWSICAASWTKIEKCVWEKLFLKWCLLTILIRQFFTFLCNWVCNSVIFQAEKIWVTAKLWIIAYILMFFIWCISCICSCNRIQFENVFILKEKVKTFCVSFLKCQINADVKRASHIHRLWGNHTHAFSQQTCILILLKVFSVIYDFRHNFLEVEYNKLNLCFYNNIAIWISIPIRTSK